MSEFDRNIDEDEAIFRDVMEACRCCDGTAAIAVAEALGYGSFADWIKSKGE